jgi:hypothetical protein
LLRDSERFGRAGLASGRFSRELVRERLALDKFQYQRRNAVQLLDPVDRTDVGVIEGRQHAGFPLEPREAVRIGSEGDAAAS